MVIATFLTLMIGLPVDQISLFLTLIQTLLALKGEMTMVNFDYMAVSGAHGVAEIVSTENVG